MKKTTWERAGTRKLVFKFNPSKGLANAQVAVNKSAFTEIETAIGLPKGKYIHV